MKKTLCMLMTLALLVSIIAVAPAASAAPAADGAIAGGREVNIELWQHNVNIKEQNPFLWWTAQAFMEENPNVHIELVGAEAREHLNKVTMAAQSGTLPDMFLIESSMVDSFVEEDLLYELTADIADLVPHFLPGMLQVQDNGSIYGLPCEVHLSCYYYNMELFDQYGVEYPKENWTQEEFLAACQTFKDAGVTPISMGALSSFACWMSCQTLVRFDFFKHYAGILSGTDVWTNDDFIKAFETMAQTGPYISPNASTLDYFQACEAFYGGNAAFLNAGAWECGKITSTGMADKVGVWLAPIFDGAPANNLAIKAGNSPYCISKKAAEDPDKLEAMLAFFKFMYGPKGTQILIDDAASVPMTIYDDTSFENASPMIQKLADALNNSFDPSLHPGNEVSPEVSAYLYDACWGAMLGTYTPEQAAEQLQSQWEISVQ